ncbi:hypothetical protein GR11A_00158 [Vibrio phage vB_VcorM_GR11A]|nr:hypothetical protein GR11A_00158 [Vibrio phage vB_VcorM_GR11A]
MAKIISAFPGCGKSTVYNKAIGKTNISDSDSSHFSKAGFPQNYLTHIAELYKQDFTCLVSSHKEVREGLRDMNLPFTLVYPSHDCKQEYIERYINRGSPEAFIKLLEEKFDEWVDECNDFQADRCTKVVLHPQEFLADVIEL